MGKFSITWRKQVENLLPVFKRSTSIIDYLTAMIDSVDVKSAEMSTFETDIRKRAKFNSQIIVLQAALNNIFGVTVAPWILIETKTGVANLVYIYNEAEGRPPTYIYNEAEGNTVYIYNDAEITTSVNFIVKIPIGIHTAELERRVKNEVNTYKLAGRTFTITTY
jgi:hypothetical protein